MNGPGVFVVEKTCPACGKVFEVPRSGALRRKACSYQCAWDLRGRRAVERTCKQCGAKFTTVPSQIQRGYGRFCSRACGYAHTVASATPRKQRKPKDPKAPPKPKRARARKPDLEWAKAVKERDGYRCRRCGRTSGQQIHAHHVITRAQAPHLKHDVSNGIALCNSCHSWVHNNPAESYANGWLGHGWEGTLERRREKVARALTVDMDDDRLRELHATPGYRVPQIAKELGVGEGSVRRRMKQLGLPSFPAGRP